MFVKNLLQPNTKTHNTSAFNLMPSCLNYRLIPETCNGQRMTVNQRYLTIIL